MSIFKTLLFKPLNLYNEKYIIGLSLNLILEKQLHLFLYIRERNRVEASRHLIYKVIFACIIGRYQFQFLTFKQNFAEYFRDLIVYEVRTSISPQSNYLILRISNWDIIIPIDFSKAFNSSSSRIFWKNLKFIFLKVLGLIFNRKKLLISKSNQWKRS